MIWIERNGNFGGLLGWGLGDLFRSFFGEFLGGVAWFAVLIIFLVCASNIFKSKSYLSDLPATEIKVNK